MYAFVLGINGKVIFGRDWMDLLYYMDQIQKAYGLGEKRRLCVYIHNASFEFQWFQKLFKWKELFATDERKPVRMLTEYGIEFRDSYILSGQGLEATANNLRTYTIEKLVGDLDYSLLRHSRTILTPKEWHYIENDGLTLMAFIQEEIERNNDNICNIPMTKTGYVRKHLRNECYHGGQAGHGSRRKVKNRNYSAYRSLMKRLTITKDEYILWEEAFMGGFTHGNAFNVGIIHNDVASYDLTSAYPAAMVLERFPMGPGKHFMFPTHETIKTSLDKYCCVFKCRMWDVMTKWKGDNFISLSKCRNIKNHEEDNGRIVKADYLETTITNIDLEIYRAFYHIGKIEVYDLWRYPRGYLPTPLIKGILELYRDKTSLKGVEGQEVNYAKAKELINSSFGCMVQKIEQQLHQYENGYWSVSEEDDIEAQIEKYNESPNRFNWYPWGVFVTAHVRKTIARAILNLGDDFVYADTDSVKFLNHEKHKRFFDDYNDKIMDKIAASSEINKLDEYLYHPSTKDGKMKPIGVFDYEGTYKRFKTLGAKRYMVEYYEPHKIDKDHESVYSLTISGVNKRVAIPALEAKAKKEGKDIFDYFRIGFVFDETMAGKNTHTYCDFEIKGKLRDYKGKWYPYHEMSFMHLEATTYKLTTTEEYYEQIYADTEQRKQRREQYHF